MRKTISVIIPVFNEEENIHALYERLVHIAGPSSYDFEIIFVDDGSKDRSFAIVEELGNRDRRVKGVQLSRNFGSHAACLAGLTYAAGDACAFISADLQDPPELLLMLAAEWENGHDIVIGVRQPEGGRQRIFPRIYWKLVRRFALDSTPETGTDVFLIDRKVVKAVVAMGEKNTSIFGLILWSGFSQAVVEYRKGARACGMSKWTLSKKIKLFVDTFVSFSYFPLRLMSVIGITTACAGFIYALVVIAARLFYARPVEGWASLMVVLLMVSGVQMMMLGILGEYLWRTFDSARMRPVFIVKDTRNIDRAD